MQSVFGKLSTAGMVIAPVLLLACGSGTVLVESTPRPDPSPTVASPPAPGEPLVLPVLTGDWQPATIGQGSGEALAGTLNARESLAILIYHDGAIDTLSDQVFEMVKATAPQIQVVMRNRATVNWMMKERGEVPYRVSLQPGGTDILGRPYLLPKEHPLNTDWLTKKQAMKGARALLTISELPFIDDAMLRRLREAQKGGCQALDSELNRAVGQLHEYFEPYRQAVDSVLADAFRRHLEPALPFWREELHRTAGLSGPGQRCAEAYRSLFDRFEPCIDRACPIGPRFHLASGGLIGMTDEPAFIPDGCPAEGHRDYWAELRDLGARAVADVLSAFDGEWTGYLVRANAFLRIESGLRPHCKPRHRRIDPQDLAAYKNELSEFIAEVNRFESTGRWELAKGQERIAGVGPVRLLARIRPSGRALDHEAHQMVKRLGQLDRCDQEGEKVFRAMLVDVGSSEVLFNGLFFKEELVCEDLPVGL